MQECKCSLSHKKFKVPYSGRVEALDRKYGCFFVVSRQKSVQLRKYRSNQKMILIPSILNEMQLRSK